MLLAAVATFILSRWSYTKMVDWPIDTTCDGEIHGHRPRETTTATSCVANMVRKCLYLPLATPWEFLLGDPARGCLGIPWPAHRHWQIAVVIMFRCASACHLRVRATTLLALRESSVHDTVDGDKQTDYAILKWGMQRIGWRTDVVECEGYVWAIEPPPFSSMWQISLVVGETSTATQQMIWGCGAVVATVEGEV